MSDTQFINAIENADYSYQSNAPDIPYRPGFTDSDAYIFNLLSFVGALDLDLTYKEKLLMPGLRTPIPPGSFAGKGEPCGCKR